MIYEGLRIKTPSVAYMKKYKSNDGEDAWSFFYNYGKRNKESGEYEILERYTIFIKNIVPMEDSEVICTKIVSVRPVVKTSRDGRKFLQCEVTIEADNVKNPKLSQYKDHAVEPPFKKSKENSNNMQQDVEVDEKILPF